MPHEGLYSRQGEPSNTAPLISTADAKAHLRVEHTDEDTLIDGLVDAAERHIEDYLDLPMRETAYEGQFRGPGNSYLGLWLSGPVVSVTSVGVFTVDRVWVDLGVEEYTLTQPRRGREDAVLNFSAEFWESTLCRIGFGLTHRPVVVRFQRGFPQDAVPASLIHAMKLMIGEYYEHREGASPFPRTELPLGIRRLLMPFQVRRL